MIDNYRSTSNPDISYDLPTISRAEIWNPAFWIASMMSPSIPIRTAWGLIMQQVQSDNCDVPSNPPDRPGGKKKSSSCKTNEKIFTSSINFVQATDKTACNRKLTEKCTNTPGNGQLGIGLKITSLPLFIQMPACSAFVKNIIAPNKTQDWWLNL